MPVVHRRKEALSTRRREPQKVARVRRYLLQGPAVDPLVHTDRKNIDIDKPSVHKNGLRITWCGVYFRRQLFEGDYVFRTGMETKNPTTCLVCLGT